MKLDALKKYFGDIWKKAGEEEEEKIIQFAEFRTFGRADEPRPSTCLIFIGRSSSSQRPSFLRIYSSLPPYVVHLGFPLLRLQEFFVYAIIINLEPTSGRGKADGKRRRKRRRERARERGNCGRG